MASSLSLLFSLSFFSLTLLVAFSESDKSKDAPPLYNYRHVCDEKRYVKLGLQANLFAFCNKTLSYTVRAKHLIDSMTLSEKVQQLGNEAKGVARLGLPFYNWWSEALHGVSDVGKGTTFKGPVVKSATSFPTPITTGSAFNESLWKAIGEATSTEARAMHNLGVSGLTFWSPNINVVRDPRWGRTLETPGEDPLVVGRYASNFVRGLQDVKGNETAEDLNARPLKVSACCKHYAAYDVDYWKSPSGSLRVERETYNANVTARDMAETFLRPFEMCVKDGDVSSVMCSYNNVNGYPACADSRLLKGTVRGEWNLHGYIVTDCDSIKTIAQKQNFLQDTNEDAVAQSMIAGVDMDCGDYYPDNLVSSINRGLIKESDIDNALFNNYIVLLRLGWFDSMPQYESLGASDVCSKENIELAADAARQGIVLLKNKNDVLPLSSEKTKKIALVGPHANATNDMIGNYAGVPCRYTSPLDGFKKYAEVDYKMGCGDVKCYNETFIWPALRASSNADATVVVVGLNLTFEAESLDRTDFELPNYQNQLIRQVGVKSKGPVILVVLSAGGINISQFIESDDIDAIIWAGYPGQEGGQAIADVVYGKYNPGGRLPVTWYPTEYLSNLPMTSMPLRPVDEFGYPGRTYKFYNGSVVFPFGFGMSYTKFEYALVSSQRRVNLNLNRVQHCHTLHYNETAYVPPCQSALVSDLDCSNDIAIEVTVKNTGTVDGSDVVLLYSRAPYGIVGAAIKQLVGFKRVFVEKGKSENVKFDLSSCETFLLVTESAYEVVPAGQHGFMIGTGENSVEFPFTVSWKKSGLASF